MNQQRKFIEQISDRLSDTQCQLQEIYMNCFQKLKLFQENLSRKLVTLHQQKEDYDQLLQYEFEGQMTLVTEFNKKQLSDYQNLTNLLPDYLEEMFKLYKRKINNYNELTEEECQTEIDKFALQIAEIYEMLRENKKYYFDEYNRISEMLQTESISLLEQLCKMKDERDSIQSKAFEQLNDISNQVSIKIAAEREIREQHEQELLKMVENLMGNMGV